MASINQHRIDMLYIDHMYCRETGPAGTLCHVIAAYALFEAKMARLTSRSQLAVHS